MALGWLLFAKGDRHLTAEMLYEEANRAKIAVSLATVYNTLHQFTDAGLLREVAVNGSKTYFDTNVSDHHHFFIESEHNLVDIPHADVDRRRTAADSGRLRDQPRRRGGAPQAEEALSALPTIKIWSNRIAPRCRTRCACRWRRTARINETQLLGGIK